MICKRTFGQLAGTAIVGLGIAFASTAPAMAQDLSQPESNQTNGVTTLQGADGLTRTTFPVEQPGVQGRNLDLQPGDEINISVDGQTAEIINAAGDVVGSFTAPQLYDDEGNELTARFAFHEGMLIVAETGPTARDACTKASVDKWTYRVGATGVCGALGAGTGGLAGGLCGLGAAAVEDRINFDKVC